MADMDLIKKPSRMSAVCEELRLSGKKVGLVPTLGALHQGHLSLIKKSVSSNDVTAVSVFVNPLQFRRKAYLAYPRDLKGDMEKAASAGADIVFAPSEEDMYPAGFSSQIRIPSLFTALKAQKIEWHYRGVLAVVLKLFNIVRPHRAYFGLKDPHQLILIERMVEDLSVPVKLVRCPTVREKDGLAKSSRNALLSGEGRKAATVFYRALCHAEEELKKGTPQKKIIAHMEKLFNQASRPGLKVEPEHMEIVDAKTLLPLEPGSRTALVFVAGRVEDLRLTDNIRVDL